MRIKVFFLTGFAINVSVGALCMAAMPHAPTVQGHEQKDCIHCVHDEHHASSDERGCLGHCLSQAKNVSVTASDNASSVSSPIHSDPWFTQYVSIEDNKKNRVAATGPPHREFIVTTIVLRL